MKKNFEVTRQFISGPLAGLSFSEVSSVSFPVGFRCEKPMGGSGYEITSCREVK